MLDEASPHHYCLKTLPINSPKFHIYESWKKKTRQGEKVISKKCPDSCCELQRKTVSVGMGNTAKQGIQLLDMKHAWRGIGKVLVQEVDVGFWKEGLEAAKRGGEI